jgi:hypothetical protein
VLAPLHRRRLREVWRSAGWPCRDMVEVELLAAGLLLRHLDAEGRETLRVSDAGVQVLAATLQRNRAAFDAHEALVARVAIEMQRAGRVVWRGLRLRAPLPVTCSAPGPMPAVSAASAASDAAVAATLREGLREAALEAPAWLPESAPAPPRRRWVVAMPDVFSIRHTTAEDHVEPVVHEIKVRRADLLADLKRADKRASYLALSSQCWYVLARGIARADEVPPDCGVMWADGEMLEVARPAPRRPVRVPLALWMALARATAEPPTDDGGQAMLVDDHVDGAAEDGVDGQSDGSGACGRVATDRRLSGR